MNTLVHIDNVSVVRNGKSILDGINWTVQAGERWVILGPNGAGKTTTIQAISGRLFPTVGTIDILGMRIGKVDVRQEIWPRVSLASAALDMRFPQGQTVADVVKTGKYGYLATWREQYTHDDDERVGSLMEKLGISYVKDRNLVHLSSGERKRVAIARALMAKPRILIFDEPTAGLDLGGRELLISTLNAVIEDEENMTPILVTHHVEEIPETFTHVLLVKNGKDYVAGKISDVLNSQYLSKVFDIPIEVKCSGGRFTARGL